MAAGLIQLGESQERCASPGLGGGGQCGLAFPVA
jgi:hypothetical protein